MTLQAPPPVFVPAQSPSASSLDLDDKKEPLKDNVSVTVVPESESLTLPLRPTIGDRAQYFYLRVFPRKTYTPFFIRRRNFALLCVLVPIFLILIIAIPIGVTRSRGPGRVKLPTGREIYAGDGTYYNPGLGACGRTDGDNDMVVAIAWRLYDSFQTGSDPNQNPVCGRKVRARRIGKTEGIEVIIVDRCTGCEVQDLDFSPKAFAMLGDEAEGRIGIEWAWA